jgi:hypothetical protein
VPVALFAERRTADAFRDRLNAEARGTLNPFVFVGDEPDAGFHRDEIEQLGLPLPLPTRNHRQEWVEWWDLCQDETTDEQRAGAWALCDQPLFEVLRVEVSDE